MAPVVITHRIECRASRVAMWTALSDTPRLNRAIGNTRLTVTPYESATGARHLVSGKLGGFPVTYEEHPFEWDHGRYYSTYRLLRGGPIRSVASRYSCEDAADGHGCVVTLRLEAVPRFAALRPFVWAATRAGVGPLVDYVNRLDAELSGALAPEPPPAVADAARLEAARARLSDRHRGAALVRLIDHVARADEFELAAIRPFELADAWGADRMAVLRLCLDAVPAGLLELRWSVLCPSCRTTSAAIPSLDELGAEAHCQACDLRFGVELDRAVEARFVPHPIVRRVDERPMCVAGPVFTPHVLSQVRVAAGGTGALRAPAEPGRYRVFVRGGGVAVVVVADGAPGEVAATARENTVAPAQLEVGPGGSVLLENREADARHAKLERTEWAFNAATAHHVGTMPEFRSLFGAASLRPGLALKISGVAILFSDLCGSTALYARVGDAAAFGVVTDSFAFGARVVEARGGTIVKTMGDAIMAAFVDPAQGLDAAAELVRAWEAFRAGTPLAEHLDIKVGLFAGPCTVVAANRTLDYFGQTVNSAARVQHLAGPRELVVASALLDAGPVPEGLRVIERFEASVKGIEAPLALVRLGL